MPTRIVDRYGLPYPTNEVRVRLGFLGGDHLPVDSGGEVTAPAYPSPVEPRYVRADIDAEEARRG